MRPVPHAAAAFLVAGGQQELREAGVHPVPQAVARLQGAAERLVAGRQAPAALGGRREEAHQAALGAGVASRLLVAEHQGVLQVANHHAVAAAHQGHQGSPDAAARPSPDLVHLEGRLVGPPTSGAACHTHRGGPQAGRRRDEQEEGRLAAALHSHIVDQEGCTAHHRGAVAHRIAGQAAACRVPVRHTEVAACLIRGVGHAHGRGIHRLGGRPEAARGRPVGGARLHRDPVVACGLEHRLGLELVGQSPSVAACLSGLRLPQHCPPWLRWQLLPALMGQQEADEGHLDRLPSQVHHLPRPPSALQLAAVGEHLQAVAGASAWNQQADEAQQPCLPASLLVVGKRPWEVDPGGPGFSPRGPLQPPVGLD